MISLLQISRRLRRARMIMMSPRDLKTWVMDYKKCIFFICAFVMMFVINMLGLIEIFMEKDFQSEFSYPLDVPDFRNLVHRFKNGENVEHQPINLNYSNVEFLITPSPDICSKEKPLGLIILMKSAPYNFHHRTTIRETWGSPQYLEEVASSIGVGYSSRLLRNYCSTYHPGNVSCISTRRFPIKIVFLLGSNKSYKKSQSHRARASTTASQYSTTKKRYVSTQKVQKSDKEDSHRNPEVIISTEKEYLQQKKDKIFSQSQENELKEKMPKLEERLTRFDAGKSISSEEDDKNKELLHEEILNNKDILLADFVDSYENNTFKTMVGLKWSLQVCKNFQYAFLVDDDMYVSVTNLIQFIERPNRYPDEPSHKDEYYDNEYLYAGKVLSNIRPMRRSNSKWHLYLDEYQFNSFPPYIPAAAIVMSKPTVEEFYFASLFTKHFRFDDIYLSILALKLNIPPLNSNFFYVCHTPLGNCDNNMKPFSNKQADPMDFVIARHGLTSPKQLKELWEEQRSNNKYYNKCVLYTGDLTLCYYVCKLKGKRVCLKFHDNGFVKGYACDITCVKIVDNFWKWRLKDNYL